MRASNADLIRWKIMLESTPASDFATVCLPDLLINTTPTCYHTVVLL